MRRGVLSGESTRVDGWEHESGGQRVVEFVLAEVDSVSFFFLDDVATDEFWLKTEHITVAVESAVYGRAQMYSSAYTRSA